MSKGKLFILSGCSGVGKSTVLTHVMAGRDDLRFSVSATTRKPRPGEREAVNYYFVSRQTFEDMIAKDAFVEYDDHMGNLYGTPRQQLEEKLFEANVILDIEPVGAFTVRKTRPDATLIFIAPPSMEELERRLRGRGTDSDEKIRDRLTAAHREYGQAHNYDYIIINDNADTAVRQLDAIITAEKCRSKLILEGEPLI